MNTIGTPPANGYASFNQPPRGRPAGVVTLRTENGSRTVVWGEPWHLGSAAYWVERSRDTDWRSPHGHALGDTLAEEVAACILGGHGIPAAIGLAAFDRLRSRGMLEPEQAATGDQIHRLLTEPLMVEERAVRYRFAAQRGHRLAGSLAVLRDECPPTEARPLRDWLMTLPGIGPKTASWVVRNRLGSDEVAIIDVHVLRAGVIAGIFEPSWTPTRHYWILEDLFLAWARNGKASAADLDAVIWSDMSRIGRDAHSLFGVSDGAVSHYLHSDPDQTHHPRIVKES